MGNKTIPAQYNSTLQYDTTLRCDEQERVGVVASLAVRLRALGLDTATLKSITLVSPAYVQVLEVCTIEAPPVRETPATLIAIPRNTTLLMLMLMLVLVWSCPPSHWGLKGDRGTTKLYGDCCALITMSAPSLSNRLSVHSASTESAQFILI